MDNSTLNNLERLANLKKEGAISEEEFEIEKKKILSFDQESKKTIIKDDLNSNFDTSKFNKKKIAAITAIGVLIVIIAVGFLFSPDDKTEKHELTQEALNEKAKKSAEELRQKQDKAKQLQKSTQDAVNQMLNILNNANMGKYIAKVSHEYVSSTSQLILEVRPNWHYNPKQVRKDAATVLWERWTNICIAKGLADSADSCRIKLISSSGDHIGGSRVLAGSLIWVAD